MENQRIRLTKRLLKDALLELLREKPLRDLAVSELCARAGINRTTFYHHYGSPADVLEDVEREHVGAIRGQLSGYPADIESLAARVEVICTYLRAHGEETKLLFDSAADVSHFALALFSATGEADMRDSLLVGYDDDTKRLLSTYLTHGIYSLVRQWLLEDVPKTPAEIGRLAYATAMHGWSRSGKG